MREQRETNNTQADGSADFAAPREAAAKIFFATGDINCGKPAPHMRRRPPAATRVTIRASKSPLGHGRPQQQAGSDTWPPEKAATPKAGRTTAVEDAKKRGRAKTRFFSPATTRSLPGRPRFAASTGLGVGLFLGWTCLLGGLGRSMGRTQPGGRNPGGSACQHQEWQAKKTAGDFPREITGCVRFLARPSPCLTGFPGWKQFYPGETA